MQRVSIAMLAIIVSSGSAASDLVVVDGPYTYGGHTYYMLDESSWTAAEAQAVQMGGNLATINDADEDAWVYATFGGDDYALWIGLNDVAQEESFVWSSGETLGYTNWAEVEPANEGGNSHYVNIHKANHAHSPGKWNDCPDWGIDPAYGIVEIPEPATLCLLAVGGLVVLKKRKT